MMYNFSTSEIPPNMLRTYNRTQLLLGCQGYTNRLATYTESVIYTTVLLSILVVSIFGNTLVCLAIKRYRSLRTYAHILLFSLAITDLLTPFFRLLFIAVSMVADRWLFGCSWCIVTAMLGNFLCAASILHLIAITIERVVVISFPMRHMEWITKTKIMIVLIFIWTLALTVGSFPLFGIVDMSFNANLMDCETYMSHDPKLSIILMLTFFLLPFAVMSYGHVRIYRIVSSQVHRMSLHRLGTTAQKRKSTMEKEWRAAKIVIVVVGTFFALWVTYFVVTVVKAYYPDSVPGWLLRLSFVLIYSNSCCNWIIYCLMNKPFRIAFKRLLLPHAADPCASQFTTRHPDTPTNDRRDRGSSLLSVLRLRSSTEITTLGSPKERKVTFECPEKLAMEVLPEVSSNTERLHMQIREINSENNGIPHINSTHNNAIISSNKTDTPLTVIKGEAVALDPLPGTDCRNDSDTFTKETCYDNHAFMHKNINGEPSDRSKKQSIDCQGSSNQSHDCCESQVESSPSAIRKCSDSNVQELDLKGHEQSYTSSNDSGTASLEEEDIELNNVTFTSHVHKNAFSIGRESYLGTEINTNAMDETLSEQVPTNGDDTTPHCKEESEVTSTVIKNQAGYDFNIDVLGNVVKKCIDN